MTAAIIDETLGGINYVLKRYGVIPHGPSFTAHLEVRSWKAGPRQAAGWRHGDETNPPPPQTQTAMLGDAVPGADAFWCS